MSFQRLPDPTGVIGKVRSRLNPKCAVRVSPFCDYIISMRMQGTPYREIETWLVNQGEIYRIAAPTIFKNLKNVKMGVKLTYAEEMLEKLGGFVNIDPIREMSQNVLTQKNRVDHLVRREQEKQKTKEGENYHDKRIKAEMQLLHEMTGKLHAMLEKLPEAAKAAAEASIAAMEGQSLILTEDSAKVLTDMIIRGEIQVGPSELLPITTTRQ